MLEIGNLQPGTRIGVSIGWRDRRGSHEATVIMVDEKKGLVSFHPPMDTDSVPYKTFFHPTPEARERFWPGDPRHEFILQKVEIGKIKRVIPPLE